MLYMYSSDINSHWHDLGSTEDGDRGDFLRTYTSAERACPLIQFHLPIASMGPATAMLKNASSPILDQHTPP